MSSSFPSSATTGEQAAISEKLDCSLEELIDGGRWPLDGSVASGTTGIDGNATNKNGILSRSHAPHYRRGKPPHFATDEECLSDGDRRPRRVTLKHNRNLDLAVRGIVRRSNKRPSDTAEPASTLLYKSPSSRRTVITAPTGGHDHFQFLAHHHRNAGPYGLSSSDTAPSPHMSSMMHAARVDGGGYRESHPYMPVRVAAQPSIYNSGGVAGMAALAAHSHQMPMVSGHPQSQGGAYFMPYTLAPMLAGPVSAAPMRLSPRDAALLSTDVAQKENGDIMVTFKQTNIITVKGDTGDLILDSGGFRTFSTRSVMNQALQPVGLQINESSESASNEASKDGSSKTVEWEVSDGRSYLVTFADGMVVKQSGTMSRQQMLARGSVIMQFLKQKKTNAEKQSRIFSKQQFPGAPQQSGRRHHQRKSLNKHPKSPNNEMTTVVENVSADITMADDVVDDSSNQPAEISSSPID